MKKKHLKVLKEFRKSYQKMLNANTLTKEMITDNLIKNLTKYQLDQLKTKSFMDKKSTK